MRDYLPPTNIFQGLPSTIHYLIMYSISILGVKVQVRNPHVTAQSKEAHVLSSMRGREVPGGEVLDMQVVMGHDLAGLVDVKLVCNSWTASFSLKFVMFSQIHNLFIVRWPQTSFLT